MTAVVIVRKDDGKNKQRQRTGNGKGQYGDSGCARMTAQGGEYPEADGLAGSLSVTNGRTGETVEYPVP
jgi:hypothetical protein